jgi:hypothetical protein
VGNFDDQGWGISAIAVVADMRTLASSRTVGKPDVRLIGGRVETYRDPSLHEQG